jgi:hypothetical protein
VARFDQPIEPMTLGNMRELGVRSLDGEVTSKAARPLRRFRRWNPGDMVRLMS